MIAVGNDLAQGLGLYIRQVDLFFDSGVLDDVPEHLRFLGDDLLDFELALVRC